MTDTSAEPVRPRLGILGGTFDPVHRGHVASALDTASAFDLERIFLVLSARPPHKGETGGASITQRLEMLELAAAGSPRLEVSDMEARRPGPSFTYDTLVAFGETFPGNSLYLMLGIDAFEEMSTWHRAADIFELANVIVTSRPGFPFPDKGPVPFVAAHENACYDPGIGCYVHNSGHVLIGHTISGIAVSASEIRSRARAGQPLDELTGPAVARYIEEPRLYGAPTR